jgi:hypothetical protein
MLMRNVWIGIAWLGAMAFAQELEIRGDVPRPYKLTLEAITNSKLTAAGAYHGVPLIDLLARAGQETGAKLRGTQVAKVVLVDCEDAYRVAFSLAELDPEFREGMVLVAVTKEGKPLDAQEGPFRLIVEKDKKMARWGRRVKSIQVVWLQDRP